MKKIIIFTLLLITRIGFGQINPNIIDENILTNQLLINGKTIEDIEATSGDNDKMISMFGNELTKSIENSLDGFLLIYKLNGLKFIYTKSNDTSSVFYLKSIEVVNNSIEVQFQGKIISVDSSIDILANSQRSQYENEHYVTYIVDSPVNIGLIVNYDKSSNKIISIEFNQELDN